MFFDGILVGAAVFLIIGICHPLVIKMEYHWGKGSWWVLLIIGLAFCILSLFLDNTVLSTICGAAAFSFFWGIRELISQENRVLQGRLAREFQGRALHRLADFGESAVCPPVPAGDDEHDDAERDGLGDVLDDGSHKAPSRHGSFSVS